MYGYDGHQLYMPKDVRICRVCCNWVELSEFRRRTGGGIASECRECHNRERAAQQRLKRQRERKKDLQVAFAEINAASRPSDVHAAANVLLGLSGGASGFAKLFLQQFNAAPAGSQMRTSMLLAGMKLIIQQAKDLDASETPIEDMTDQELDDYLQDLHGKNGAK